MEKEQTKGKFLEIACPRCNKIQIVFGKSTTLVKCPKCNYLLLKSKGGKAKVRAPIREVI